jgi:hypothetical protein
MPTIYAPDLEPGQRIEILWTFHCPQRKKEVTEWLPGVFVAYAPYVSLDKDGNEVDRGLSVRADCGKVAQGAHPNAIRLPEEAQS